jgi:NADH dehydrogenase
MRVLILGGTGFVGRALLHRLSRDGHHLTVVVRRLERHRDLLLIPNVLLVETRHFSSLFLRKHINNKDVVINLIGILHEHGKTTFNRVHVGLARKIVAACSAEGVKRVLHISALGASIDAPSAYLRSKAEAQAIMHNSGLEVTSFSPSVIFGDGDHFISTFYTMLSRLPILGVVCPQAKLSPIWVEDVVDVMAKSLINTVSIGKNYELCGGRTYSMLELIRLIGEFVPSHTRLLPLSDMMSRIMARVMGVMPTPLFSMDNYYSLQVPSVCTSVLPFDIQPKQLRVHLVLTFTPYCIRARYMISRQSAGRNANERINGFIK